MSVHSWKAKYDAYLQRKSDKSAKSKQEIPQTDPFGAFVIGIQGTSENRTVSRDEAIQLIQ